MATNPNPLRVTSKTFANDQMSERMQFYTAVGQGISNWTRMEGRIVHLGAELLDSDIQKTGVVFYSITNFNVWLGIIAELLSLNNRLRLAKKEWNGISNRLRELNDTRVRLAHHTIWSPLSSDQVFSRPAPEDHRSKSRGYSNLTALEILNFTKATNQMVPQLLELQRRCHSARMAL
jgi:hypothetical protein